MFDQIKEEIKADYYQQNFPNDGQRFLAWYLRNIHQRDMNQTRDDITDGADDKQIDAVVIDDERETIYVLQGKFIGSDKVDAEPLREVLSAWVQLKRPGAVAGGRERQAQAEAGRHLAGDGGRIRTVF